jgi:hypothetical protein
MPLPMRRGAGGQRARLRVRGGLDDRVPTAPKAIRPEHPRAAWSLYSSVCYGGRRLQMGGIPGRLALPENYGVHRWREQRKGKGRMAKLLTQSRGGTGGPRCPRAARGQHSKYISPLRAPFIGMLMIVSDAAPKKRGPKIHTCVPLCNFEFLHCKPFEGLWLSRIPRYCHTNNDLAYLRSAATWDELRGHI